LRLAAPPPDVWKGFAFPIQADRNSGYARICEAEPRYKLNNRYGKAKPFRTTSGRATTPLRIVSISIQQAHVDEILDQSRDAAPHECCGLLGGAEGRTQTVYPLRNLAADPLVTYEASPEDLFAAQRSMRERGEQLLAIYHSHPRSAEPQPSETDVRLAYYPTAVYLIVGLGGEQPGLGAFRISEGEGSWVPVEYEIIADSNP
jgi:proteasome lid subunit RPN8/RPN11